MSESWLEKAEHFYHRAGHAAAWQIAVAAALIDIAKSLRTLARREGG